MLSYLDIKRGNRLIFVQSSESQEKLHNIIMPETEIAKHYLGSGYDICGKYADGVSVKRKIFDLTKVPKESIREHSATFQTNENS